MSDRKFYASLDLKGDNVSVILVRSVIVLDAFEAHTLLLPNPPIPTPVLKSQIGSLEDAQTLVKKRVPNSAPARNTARTALCNTLDLYRSYLQLTADASTDPASVIVAGGMKVVELKPAPKALLDARLGQQSAVVLRAHAKLLFKGKTARFFNWQYSIDGGQTWLNAPSTPYAMTTITGLPTMTTVSFRVCATHKGGQSEWSPPVSLVVV